MLELHPRLLWLGNALDIREPRSLFELGIEAVVDLAYEEPPAPLPRQLVYCRFPLLDGGGNEPSMLRLTIQTLASLLHAETPAVVACSAGMSRSPTIASFALAFHLGESPDDVLMRIADAKALEIKRPLWDDCERVYPQVRRTD